MNIRKRTHIEHARASMLSLQHLVRSSREIKLVSMLGKRVGGQAYWVRPVVAWPNRFRAPRVGHEDRH